MPAGDFMTPIFSWENAMKVMTLNALHFSRNDREFAEPVDFRWLADLFREKLRLIPRA
jgi:hypothetical protein